jgi:hypothetical protein
MRQDVFGNLEDWGHVLERLAEFTRNGEIEGHQDSLIVLLRYPDNWRLREAALESVPAIRRPTAPLVREICGIVLNDGLYFQVRVLAAEALSAVLDRLAERSPDAATGLRREIREQMHTLLNSQDVPVLHQAARRILPKIE